MRPRRDSGITVREVTKVSAHRPEASAPRGPGRSVAR